MTDDPRSARAADAAAARRKALSTAARRQDTRRGFARMVRPDERRRYVFQLWTTSAFAVAWLLVFFLSGAWLFLVLAGGFALLAGLAAVALRVLRAGPGSERDGQAL